MVVAKILSVYIAPSDIILDDAVGAKACVKAFLCKVEGALAFRHIVDDLVEGSDGITHFVVLGGDHRGVVVRKI